MFCRATDLSTAAWLSSISHTGAVSSRPVFVAFSHKPFTLQVLRVLRVLRVRLPPSSYPILPTSQVLELHAKPSHLVAQGCGCLAFHAPMCFFLELQGFGTRDSRDLHRNTRVSCVFSGTLGTSRKGVGLFQSCVACSCLKVMQCK